MPLDETPRVGHNRNIEVTEDRFLAHVAAIEAAQAKVDAAKVVLKQARRQAKADGIRLKVLDEARKRSEMSREDVEEHFLHTQFYMKWLRHQISHQFELDLGAGQDGDFEDEDVVKAKASEQAQQDGFWDGLRGTEQSDKYPANTDLGQAYLAAYNDGLARREHESQPVSDDD